MLVILATKQEKIFKKKRWLLIYSVQKNCTKIKEPAVDPHENFKGQKKQPKKFSQKI